MSTRAVEFASSLDGLWRHLARFAAAHPEILDEGELLRLAIAERWGAMDPRAALELAAMLSLRQARQRANKKGERAHQLFFL